jgi:hypothetical protein
MQNVQLGPSAGGGLLDFRPNDKVIWAGRVWSVFTVSALAFILGGTRR